jgi:hypothetical protein
VDRLIIDIDALGQEIVNLISAEDLQNREHKDRAARPRRPVRETVG